MDDEEQKPVGTRKYCPPNFIDKDDGNYEIMEGAWRGLIDNSALYRDLVNMKRNSGTNAAKSQRNVFRIYKVRDQIIRGIRIISKRLNNKTCIIITN